ncbi:hypothetical protein [Thermoanaerobacterium thermosaccharolyticum]|nr:hypothetical protein [Thermoanaerobacterium thermosaccharolyticum]
MQRNLLANGILTALVQELFMKGIRTCLSVTIMTMSQGLILVNSYILPWG